MGNTIKNDFTENELGKDVYKNTFSGKVSNNTFGGEVVNNTFSQTPEVIYFDSDNTFQNMEFNEFQENNTFEAVN